MRKSDKVLACAKFLKSRLKGHPRIALILGSGWANALDKDFIIDSRLLYSSLPHFPSPSIKGHKGELLICHIRNIPVLILSGRVHYYEGCGMEDVVLPIRVLAGLGIKQIILTNAAGSINPKFRVGNLMLITDQINFQLVQLRPLVCRRNSRLLALTSTLKGLRYKGGSTKPSQFCHLNEPNALYNRSLIRLAEKVGRSEGVRLRKGVYVGVTGPNFETPAEIKMFRKLGADAVGMSTVAEASVATHLGMDVLGISCMVNKAAGLSKQPLGHMDVLRTMQRIKKPLGRLIKGIIDSDS